MFAKFNSNLRVFLTIRIVAYFKFLGACLSYDVAPGSEITPCNKIDKPPVVYRFSENVMTSIIVKNYNVFTAEM